uniref:BTB domain-containing protein n=1 Tax=Caenorhabditis tropicalis TaxID=1561998 RepID=A0A1I7TGR4_9PELO
MAPVEKKFVLTHIAENISRLKNWLFTDEEEHFGVPWVMGVHRENSFLSFYLYCDYEPEKESWSIQVSFDIKLLSVTGKSKVFTINSYNFTNDLKFHGWGNLKFVEWEEMEKDYMIDGDLIIEVHFNIHEMAGIEKKKLRNFDESVKQFSDVVLIVNDEKFYVSKLFLATQSIKFEDIFSKKNTRKQKTKVNREETIVLKDVDSKDFQSFLECVYGDDSIDEETVDGILKVADTHNAKVPLQKCENFLIRDSERTVKEKLELANRFKFDKLKNECLFKINTATEIRSVLPSNLNEMDPSVVGTLLQKTLALIPFT